MYNEFLSVLCNLLIVALLTALPLYTGQGYWQLGDTKYFLFRNISLLCMGCWLVLGMPGRIKAVAEYGKLSGEGVRRNRRLFSAMDWAMAAYAVCVVVSALCSAYGQLAWTGYTGWHMGAVSQLLFVGIYFFVSRQYTNAGWPLYLGEAAFFIVTVLGLLHRVGIDPLGLLEGWTSWNWEYSHMLSTLGNINWLCGYYSVMLAFVMACYLQEKRMWLCAIWYGVTVSALVLLGIQGSQGGLLILAACAAACLFLGGHSAAMLQRLFLAFAGFFAGMPLMGWLMELRGEKAAVVKDGNVFAVVRWYVWPAAAIVCVLFWMLLREKGGSGEARQKRGKTLAVIMLIGGIAATLLLLIRLFWGGIDDSFGSGRGYLWRISMESFRDASWKDKLLGAGPDCYAEAVFARQGGTDVWNGDHWEGAIFTNAHCEVLSQLCNVGIIGTISYLAIFLAGWCRYGGVSRYRLPGGRGSRGGGQISEPDRDRARVSKDNEGKGWELDWVGLLAVAMYGVHSLISFQQVLAAPLLFLTLGLCESRVRQGR